MTPRATAEGRDCSRSNSRGRYNSGSSDRDGSRTGRGRSSSSSSRSLLGERRSRGESSSSSSVTPPVGSNAAAGSSSGTMLSADETRDRMTTTPSSSSAFFFLPSAAASPHCSSSAVPSFFSSSPPVPPPLPPPPSASPPSRRPLFIASGGRDRLYWPTGEAAPPPPPQAAGRWRNPLLDDLPSTALLLRLQEPLQLLQQQEGDVSSAAPLDDAASPPGVVAGGEAGAAGGGGAAAAGGAGGGGAGGGAGGGGGGAFVGQLLGACSEEEMLDKQQVSTANDFERLEAEVPGDPEARIVNPYLAVASFRRSDAGKPFHPSSTRPAVWCRRTVHQLLTYALDADLTNPSPAVAAAAAAARKAQTSTPAVAGEEDGPAEGDNAYTLLSSSSSSSASSFSSTSSFPSASTSSSSALSSSSSFSFRIPSASSSSASSSSSFSSFSSSVSLPPKTYLYSREGRGYTFLDVYNFFRDRLRACWQHLTVQHLQKHRGYIETLEISIRFLIFAEEQVAASPAFDGVSNQSLLTTCLDKLMHGYEAVRAFQARKEVALLFEYVSSSRRRRRRRAAALGGASAVAALQLQKEEKERVVQRQRTGAAWEESEKEKQQKPQRGERIQRKREEEEEEEDEEGSVGAVGSIRRLLGSALLVDATSTQPLQADCMQVDRRGHHQQREKEKKGEGKEKCGWTLLETLVWRSAYEGEFWAYRILCLMSSSSSEQALVGLLQRLPSELQAHPSVRLALRAFAAFRSCNMRRFIICMRSGDYLTAALLNKYANYARARVLQLLLNHRLVLDQRNPMPLERLRTLLGFDGEPDVALYSFLTAYGIRVAAEPGRQGALFCSFAAAKRSLLQDLNSFRKVRAASYPSLLLHLPAGISRQQLLDPDYPTPAAAAAALPSHPPMYHAASASLTGAAAASTSPLPPSQILRTFFPPAADARRAGGTAADARRAGGTAAAVAATAAAVTTGGGEGGGGVLQMPPVAGEVGGAPAATAIAARQEEAAAAVGMGRADFAAVAADGVSLSAASLALKNKLQAAWTRARRQAGGDPDAGSHPAAAAGEEDGEDGTVLSEERLSAGLLAAAGSIGMNAEEARAAAIPQGLLYDGQKIAAAAAAASDEGVLQETHGTGSRATALVGQQQQQQYPSRFQQATALPPATAVKQSAKLSEAAAAAAVFSAGRAGDLLQQKDARLLLQQKQAGGEEERQQMEMRLPKALLQQQQQPRRSLGGIAERTLDAAAAAAAGQHGTRPPPYCTEGTVHAGLLKQRQQQQQQQESPLLQRPSRSGEAGAASAAAFLPGAAATGIAVAAAAGGAAAAATSRPTAAAAPPVEARKQPAFTTLGDSTAAATAASAASEETAARETKQQQRQELPLGETAAAAASKPAAASRARGGGGARMSGQQAAAGGRTAAMRQGEERGRQATVAAARGGEGEEGRRGGTAAAAPAVAEEGGKRNEAGERREDEEGEKEKLSLSLGTRGDEDFWSQLVGLSNWRHERVRQLALKELLSTSSADKGKSAHAAATAFSFSSTAAAVHTSSAAAQQTEDQAQQPLAGTCPSKTRKEKEKIEKEEEAKGEEAEHLIDAFPWCFYPPSRRREGSRSNAAAAASRKPSCSSVEDPFRLVSAHLRVPMSLPSPPLAATSSPPPAATAVSPAAAATCSSFRWAAPSPATAAAAAAEPLAAAAASHIAPQVGNLSLSLPHLNCFHLVLQQLPAAQLNFADAALPEQVAAVLARPALQQQRRRRAPPRRSQQMQWPLSPVTEGRWSRETPRGSSCSGKGSSRKERRWLSPLFSACERQAAAPQPLRRAGRHTTAALGMFCKYLFVGGRQGGDGEEVWSGFGSRTGPQLSDPRFCSSSSSSSSSGSSSSGSSSISSGSSRSWGKRGRARAAAAAGCRGLQGCGEEEVGQLLYACLRESVGAGSSSCRSSPTVLREGHLPSMHCEVEGETRRRSSSSTGEWRRAAGEEEKERVIEKRCLILRSLASLPVESRSENSSSRTSIYRLQQQMENKEKTTGCSSNLLLWEGKRVALLLRSWFASEQKKFVSGRAAKLLQRQQPQAAADGPSLVWVRRPQQQRLHSRVRGGASLRQQSRLTTSGSGFYVPLYCCLHALPEGILQCPAQEADAQEQWLFQQQQQQQKSAALQGGAGRRKSRRKEEGEREKRGVCKAVGSPCCKRTRRQQHAEGDAESSRSAGAVAAISSSSITARHSSSSSTPATSSSNRINCSGWKNDKNSCSSRRKGNKKLSCSSSSSRKKTARSSTRSSRKDVTSSNSCRCKRSVGNGSSAERTAAHSRRKSEGRRKHRKDDICRVGVNANCGACFTTQNPSSSSSISNTSSGSESWGSNGSDSIQREKQTVVETDCLSEGGEEETAGEEELLLKEEEVFDGVAGAFLALPFLVAVCSATSTCCCNFGIRVQQPSAHAATANATSQQAGEAKAAAAAAAVATAGGGYAHVHAAAAAVPCIWWENLEPEREMEKSEYDWWLRQTRRLLLLLHRLDARPGWCAQAKKTQQQGKRRNKKQLYEQKQPHEQQQQQEGRRKMKKPQYYYYHQQQDDAEEEGSEQGTAGYKADAATTRNEEAASLFEVASAGPQVRILFALLVPLHAFTPLYLQSRMVYPSFEESSGGKGGRKSTVAAPAAAAAATAEAPRERRAALYDSSLWMMHTPEEEKTKLLASDETAADDHGNEGGRQTGKTGLKPCIDMQVQSEAQALVAAALKSRLMQAARRHFSHPSNSRISSAALAALTSRVRLTCAAYIPVSRCLLSAASNTLSCSYQQQQCKKILPFLFAAPATKARGEAAEGFFLLGDQQQPTHHGKAQTAAPRAAARDVALSKCQQVMSLRFLLAAASAGGCLDDRGRLAAVPAHCWIRRACRSITRAALGERRLLLLERPQRPLPIMEAILCQWKVLLQNELEVIQRRVAAAATMKRNEELPLKKGGETGGADGWFVAPFAAAKWADEEIVALVRSWREPEKMTRLLLAAADAVKQRIHRVSDSAWQLPPRDWWWVFSRRESTAGVERLQNIRQESRRKTCYEHHRRSNSGDATRRRSGSTLCRRETDCSRIGKADEKGGGGRFYDEGGENEVHPAWKGELSRHRKLQKRSMKLTAAAARPDRVKALRDVLTGKPLLQTESQHLLRALISDPASCQHVSKANLYEAVCAMYSRERALRAAHASAEALFSALQEPKPREKTVTGKGGYTRKKRNATEDDSVLSSEEKFMRRFGIMGSEAEELKSAVFSPCCLPFPRPLSPSTLGEELDLLQEAAVNSLQVIFCGSGLLWRIKKHSKRAAVEADYAEATFLSLPTSAWQLLDPVAVRPWKGRTLPFDLLTASALVRRKRYNIDQHEEQKCSSQDMVPDRAPGEECPDLQLIQIVSSTMMSGSGCQDELSKARSRSENHTPAEAGNPMPGTTGEQEGQQGSRRERPAFSPLSSTRGNFTDAPELRRKQRRREHCTFESPVVQNAETKQLTLQVLAAAKQCRMRAAAERDAMEKLLSLLTKKMGPLQTEASSNRQACAAGGQLLSAAASLGL